MTDSTDDFHFSEDYSLAPLIDDCNLVGRLLDDSLRQDVGEDLFQKVLQGCGSWNPLARLVCTITDRCLL